MRTQEQIENDIRRLTDAFRAIERAGDRDANVYCLAILKAGKLQDELFAEIDRLSRLAAYTESLLRPELEALTALRDTKDAYETMANVSEHIKTRYIDDIFRDGIKWAHARISAAGIARIREIEELLK